MELEIGSVVTGKVTGITKFGAFVSVSPDRTGLVHISEISATFVNEVSDYLTIGQDVTVKIINMDAGKLYLSIKAASADAAVPPPRDSKPARGGTDTRRESADAKGAAPDTGSSFEDRLQKFMRESDNKISGMRQFSDKRGARRRGK
ncbi:MAG: S1 RNA-binding domain-containing protein [Oscillospiraceae bacterium]|jgi:S1 RNA binding domain protein|nr:S1 RNA-binding domain-containing protein [Oscillospiraceae bacterium]